MEKKGPGREETTEPVVLGRSEHSISRRHIDPDALRILFRLHSLGFTAYLTGGAVRDLLLGKDPKDFDIATDARPGQVKKHFGNAFIIGRRFRLAHIRFRGGKIIEVATFRREPGPDAPEPLRIIPGHGKDLHPGQDEPKHTGEQQVPCMGPSRHAGIHEDHRDGKPM